MGETKADFQEACHVLKERKGLVPGDNLDICVTMPFSLALEKSSHFHALVADVF